MQDTARVPRNIVSAAKYFPIIIPVILTGEVRRSCSVRSFFSSEKSFIVSKGISTIKLNISMVKYPAVL